MVTTRCVVCKNEAADDAIICHRCFDLPLVVRIAIFRRATHAFLCLFKAHDAYAIFKVHYANAHWKSTRMWEQYETVKKLVLYTQVKVFSNDEYKEVLLRARKRTNCDALQTVLLIESLTQIVREYADVCNCY